MLCQLNHTTSKYNSIKYKIELQGPAGFLPEQYVTYRVSIISWFQVKNEKFQLAFEMLLDADEVFPEDFDFIHKYYDLCKLNSYTCYVYRYLNECYQLFNSVKISLYQDRTGKRFFVSQCTKDDNEYLANLLKEGMKKIKFEDVQSIFMKLGGL